MHTTTKNQTMTTGAPATTSVQQNVSTQQLRMAQRTSVVHYTDDGLEHLHIETRGQRRTANHLTSKTMHLSVSNAFCQIPVQHDSMCVVLADYTATFSSVLVVLCFRRIIHVEALVSDAV